jgi:ATP-dependent Lon protease
MTKKELPAWCAGFTFSNQTETLHFFDAEDESINRTELYLPWAQRSYARESYTKAQVKDSAARKAREAAKSIVNAEPDEDEDVPVFQKLKDKSFLSNPRKVDESENEDLTAFRNKFEDDQESLDTNEWTQVYDFKEPLKLKSVGRHNDKDRVKLIFSSLSKTGNFRRITRLENEKLQDAILELKSIFPLFAAATDYIANELGMCLRKDLPPHFSPVLLVGPPGIGKTHYTKAVATVTGLAYQELSFASEIKSSAILGADRGWGNSQTGLVFDAVTGEGRTVNPIILLDELDKARSNYDSYYQPPYASLHSLFEPLTAKSVTDISVGMSFDAGNVSWICTANDIHRIPASIQSRLKIFHVDLPTDPEVALQVAYTMIKAVHQASSITGFKKPGKEVARLIAHLSLREMRMALEEAFARATGAGRMQLQESDFPGLVSEPAGSKSQQLLH